MSTPDTPVARYRDRIATFSVGHARAQRQWGLLGNLRFALIIALAIVAWQWWGGRSAALVLLAGAIAAVYLVLVIVQRRFRERRDAARRMLLVNERALARLEQRWDDLPLPPDAGTGRDHPYAYDLNVIGRASLAQRVGTPVTAFGWDALHRSLLRPVSPSEIVARQEAVAELAAGIDIAQRVEAAGLREDEPLPDPSAFVAWARSAPWLSGRAWLRVWMWVGPAAVIVLFVLWWLDVVAGPWYIVPIIGNGLVFTLFGQEAAKRVQAIVPLREAIAEYRDIFSLIAGASPSSTRLREIDRQFEDGQAGALARVGALARIVSLAIPPGAIIYFPLQLAFMWDLHVLRLLERWQESAGNRVEGWLAAVGEWEALAALAVLRRDHPAWAFPRVEEGAERFDATAMAHPLLPVSQAVANDVEIGPVGQFLFVTGSNMSGKSTLLRAIGANAVLAQAGGPVFAEAQTMPPLRVWTCMRVEDSLEQGVSFFMAELQRLKRVVDGVSDSSPTPALYLLDEILQGTNTGERQIASRRVLAALVREQAFGAVSSHDLELIDGSALEDAARQVHFAEVFTREDGEPQMTFDYLLRPGPATSSNALALMELIGFDLGRD